MTFRLVTDTFAQLDVPLRSLRLKSPTLHNSYLQEAEATKQTYERRGSSFAVAVA